MISSSVGTSGLELRATDRADKSDGITNYYCFDLLLEFVDNRKNKE